LALPCVGSSYQVGRKAHVRVPGGTMKPPRFPGTLLGALALAGLALGARTELPPLIPREVLLGNPARAQGRLAPDASRYSYLAPSDKGVLNVWVQTPGKDDAVMVTNDLHRGIQQHSW